MSPAVEFFLLLAILAIFFVTEIIPLALTAIIGSAICAVLGFIPVERLFIGLSNPIVVFIAGMYIIGASLLYTGLAQRIGLMILEVCGKSETGIMVGLMVVATLFSAILSNTGTAACLLPIVLGICAANGFSSSHHLMPLAFACGWGGMITLVGSPSNIIANIALGSAGLEKFSFFDFAYIGIPLSIVGIIYMMTIGREILFSKTATNKSIVSENLGLMSPDNVKKQIISGIILLSIILVMAFDVRSISLDAAAIIGAMICVLAKCLTEKQAYSSIDWNAIFLFAAMIPLAEAMNFTGASKLIADFGMFVIGDAQSPYLVMTILFLLSCGLTQFMPNTASAILLCPLGISMAQALGANPRSVVIAIVVGSSCAYATPLGTASNMLVLGYGNYTFKDYLKVGSGLVFLSFLVSVLIIPAVWPFF